MSKKKKQKHELHHPEKSGVNLQMMHAYAGEKEKLLIDLSDDEAAQFSEDAGQKDREDIESLCADVNRKLKQLSKHGISGMLLVAMSNGEPFMVDAGGSRAKLQLISNMAVPNILDDKDCTKGDAAHLLSGVEGEVVDRLLKKE